MGESSDQVERIVLTASGGPFAARHDVDFAKVKAAEALNHPRWNMGKKVTIDSATLMNKGLEVMEARWLFNASAEQIQVVIHPQSVIHSMVQYKDGSVLAQLGQPDMRTPIGHALAYPQRIDCGVEPLDFFKVGQLTFEQPDFARYPCLELAINAHLAGLKITEVPIHLRPRIGRSKLRRLKDGWRSFRLILIHCPNKTIAHIDVLGVGKTSKCIKYITNFLAKIPFLFSGL